MSYSFTEGTEEYSEGPHADVLSGNCLRPQDVLDDAEEIQEVQDAIDLVNAYIDDAESQGVLEIG